MDVTVQAMSGVMSITGFPDRAAGEVRSRALRFLRRHASLRRHHDRAVRAREDRARAAWSRSRCRNRCMRRSARISACITARATSCRRGPAIATADSPKRRTTSTRPATAIIAIICNNNRHFHALLKAMEREDLKDDPRLLDLKARVANIDFVDKIVGEWTMRLRARHVDCVAARAPRSARTRSAISTK